MTTHDYPQPIEKALSLKQQQAAALLASGRTIEQTAREVEISEKSIDNWKKIPAFREATSAAETEIYEDSLKLLKRSARAAIMTLIACMDPKSTGYVRVQAASKILDLGVEVFKVATLEQEVSELRKILQEKSDEWQA